MTTKYGLIWYLLEKITLKIVKTTEWGIAVGDGQSFCVGEFGYHMPLYKS